MKKFTFIFSFFFLCLFIDISSAVEVTLHGPKQYTRNKGKPEVVADTFPGKAGVGTLFIQNGTVEGENRVSSAIVKVNGQKICRPKDLNQNVYELEFPVSLNESNSISVELRSEVGSYLTIEIKQDMQVESGAVFGSLGGTFRVMNSSSPLFGIEIFVPEGTVNEPTIFTVSLAESEPETPLPNGISQDGPMISFEASSDLLGPVVADIPFSDRVDDYELLLFLHYNEASDSWELVDPLPSFDPSKMKALLPNFSTYSKGRVRINLNSIHSGFSFEHDVLAANNDRRFCIFDSGSVDEGGICVGMSLVAQTYFNHFAARNGEGLKCWWEVDTSWDIGCEAHGIFNEGRTGWIEWCLHKLELWGVLGGTLTCDTFLIDLLKLRLSLGLTTTINMLNVLPFPIYGHSVLVVGWERTGLFTGRFIVYDNQDNERIMHMNYFRVGLITRMDYQDTDGDDYDTFARASIFGHFHSLIYDLIDEKPREYPQYPPCGTGGGELPFEEDWNNGSINSADWLFINDLPGYGGHKASVANGELFINAINDWTQSSGILLKHGYGYNTKVTVKFRIESVIVHNQFQTIIHFFDSAELNSYESPVRNPFLSLGAGNNSIRDLFVYDKNGIKHSLGHYNAGQNYTLEVIFTASQTRVRANGFTVTLPEGFSTYHLHFGGHVFNAYFDDLVIEQH